MGNSGRRIGTIERGTTMNEGGEANGRSGLDPGDPRTKPGFRPEWWPKCDGGEAPAPETEDAHERRCLGVLALYYQRNRWNSVQPEGSGFSADAMASKVREVDAALEAFEDRYAAIGFFGEAEMDGDLCRNVTFVRPTAPRMGPECRMESSSIAIPGLDEIPASELRGVVRVVRWSHGKVDL